jgi:Xaa-Pro dipeptidase
MITPDYAARQAKLAASLRHAGLDYAAIVPGANLFYLTGLTYHTTERPIIGFFPAEGAPFFIVPSFEITKLQSKGGGWGTFGYTDAEGHDGAFRQACAQLAGKKIGVEGLRMRALEIRLLEQNAANAHILLADDALNAMRLHKDEAEIAAMRKAIQITEAALESTIKQIKPGMTERQIGHLLQALLTEGGSQENAFDPAILSGPKSALPHGTTDDTPVQQGDLLLFDFGGRYSGYPADITRVFAIGKPSDELVKIYETVLAANQAAFAVARPGVPAQEVDRAARGLIEKAGYGQYFTHRTGHGLGIDVHEAPYMREGNTQLLEPGMIFTIEPGIYVPGLGGVRIEDDVLVTTDGVESLTSYPRQLRMIGI